MNKLTINHLQTVVAIAENEGNMTQAARKLNLTQSALSHRLQEAETRLGVQLFYRRNKKLFLSKSGKVLYASALSILKQLHATEFDIERMMGGIEHVIRISTTSYNCYHWFPNVLKAFYKEQPDVDVEIVAEANRDPLYALKQGKIDLAITHLKPDPAYFNAVELFDDEMVAILSDVHALNTKPSLSQEDFEDQVFVTNATTPEEGREYDLFFRNSNYSPKRIICAGHTDVIVRLVQEQLGVSILTRWIMEQYTALNDISIKPLTKNGIYIKWYSVTRKNTHPSEKVFLFEKSLLTLVSQSKTLKPEI